MLLPHPPFTDEETEAERWTKLPTVTWEDVRTPQPDPRAHTDGRLRAQTSPPPPPVPSRRGGAGKPFKSRSTSPWVSLRDGHQQPRVTQHVGRRPDIPPHSPAPLWDHAVSGGSSGWGANSQPRSVLAVWPYTSHCASLSLSPCNTGKRLPTLQAALKIRNETVACRLRNPQASRPRAPQH